VFSQFVTDKLSTDFCSFCSYTGFLFADGGLNGPKGPFSLSRSAAGIPRGERAALSNGAPRVQRHLHPVAAVVSHAE